MTTSQRFRATRQIGIDAGHRVTNHESKCQNLHGHRYTISAEIEGCLQESGSSEGMVMDFGFLKTVMMQEIDAPCDHGMILWVRDPLLTLFAENGTFRRSDQTRVSVHAALSDVISGAPYRGATFYGLGGKLYVVNFVPTAENLAQHWFYRLRTVLRQLVVPCTMASLRVDETPNAFAIFTDTE